MRRREFIRTSLAAVPFIGLGRGVDPSVLGHQLSIDAALEHYSVDPTPAKAKKVTSLLTAAPGPPLAAPFTELVDQSILIIEARVADGDLESARLAFRLHSAVYPGSVRSSLNEVIGNLICVDPEGFLELLAEHPHMIGNRKILLNLGLDYVDDFDRQEREIGKRVRAFESVKRDDLAAVQREVLEILYGRLHRCRH